MTPDEHRAKAEELRAAAEGIARPHIRTPDTRDRLIAEAQLHATLALGGLAEQPGDEWVEKAVAVLAEMERHAPLPNPAAFYAFKLREALGVTGPLVCRCGSCRGAS